MRVAAEALGASLVGHGCEAPGCRRGLRAGEVRAGVAKRYRVVTWDAAAERAVPHKDWVTGVSVNRYTLREADGVWKIFGSEHWRFYDPVTHQLGTGR